VSNSDDPWFQSFLNRLYLLQLHIVFNLRNYLPYRPFDRKIQMIFVRSGVKLRIKPIEVENQ